MRSLAAAMAFKSTASPTTTCTPDSTSAVVPTSASSVPLLHPSAVLPLDASPACPQLAERRDTYERLYLSAILHTLNKHDSKYQKCRKGLLGR